MGLDRVRLVGVMTSVALFGCSQSHPNAEIAPGIYDLTVQSETEACSPPRAVGAMGRVAVLVQNGAVDAPVPEGDDSLLTAPRVVLEPSSSFHTETNRRPSGCDTAFVHEEWTVLASDGATFDLLHTQQWQGIASCAGAEPLRNAPSADCMSERRLRYDLAQACVAPCRLVLGESLAVGCSCE